MPHWFWILGASQLHAIGIKICQGLCRHRTLVSVFRFAKLQRLLRIVNCTNSLFNQITMKVTTKCQIGFWGHFLKVRWHCNRASHHCREVQYYIANTICLNILVLVLLSFHVVNSIPEVLQEICMHINLCMCTASPTYGIVFTCVIYKYPTIVIRWNIYTLNFQWLSIIIHSIIIICQAFCQSFCFAVGISSIRSVGPFLVQHCIMHITS